MSETTAKERALVVDDDPEICDLLSRIMAFRKIKTDTAGTAEDALALLSNNNYQIAFLDIMLPDKSGIVLLTEAKKTSPQTQFLMVSGYVTLLNAMDAMRKGAFSMVLKPIEDIDRLLAEVDLALSRTHHWRDLFSQLQRMKRAAANGDAE